MFRDGCSTITCSLERGEIRECHTRIEAVGDGQKASSVDVILTSRSVVILTSSFGHTYLRSAHCGGNYGSGL